MFWVLTSPARVQTGARRALTVAYLSAAFPAPGLNRSIVDDDPELSVNMCGERIPLAWGQDLAVRVPINGSERVQLEYAPLIFAGYGTQTP